MSNQRPGKTSGTKAGMDADGINLRSVSKVLEEARVVLEDRGEEDAAFYFEQMRDYFMKDYEPYKGIDRIEKVLGL